MNIRGHELGVCSWSLQPKNMADLVAQVRDLGLEHIHLGLLWLLELNPAQRKNELRVLADSGLKITAGMMSFPGEDYATIARIRETGGYVADDLWPARRQLTIDAARLAADLAVTLITVHVGFIPPSNQPGYAILVGRMRELAASLAEMGVDITMETGQEPASELLQFINDLAVRNVYVNFDPANMILYGAGDPIEAVHVLGQHIRHVHVKDATLSSQPGVKWGEEVPFGTGQVGPRALLDAFDGVGFTGPLAIEREVGDTRFQDVRAAIEALQEAE